MNKVLFLIFGLLPFILFSQTELNNFKIKNQAVLWQKIVNDSLPIQSQELKLRATGLPVMTTTFWLSDIDGANLIVDFKDGKTRLTVKDIYSISSTKLDYGYVEQNIKRSYLEEMYINSKGQFKKLFIRKDGNLINQIIEREIKNLIDQKNDDW